MSVHFSEVEHRHLLDFFVNAPAIIALTRGPEHVIELVNPQFLAMAGRSNLAEVIGQPASEAFPELAAVGYVDLADQVYASGVPFVSAEMPTRRDRDGDGVIDSIWTNVVIQPLRNARGEVEGLFLHGFDVTDQVVARQQAEELSAKLAAERGFLEAVLRQMPAGVAIVEVPTGEVLLANDQIEQMWGESDPADPLPGDTRSNGLPSDIPTRPLVEAIGRGEVVIGQETALRRTDGAPATIQMSAAPIRAPDGKIVAGVVSVVDVTARKQAERAQALLAEASAILAESFEEQDFLDRLARVVVPTLADWCQIHVVEADGQLRCLAAAHAGPGGTTLVEKIRQEIHPVDPASDRPIAQVFRTGFPRLLETVSNDYMTRAARDAEELRLFQALAPNSAMLAPLRARGQSLGVVTFARLDGKPPYTTNDLVMAQEMVRRAALALDNVRLYRAEKQAREEAERTAERIGRLQAITAALVEKRPLYDVTAFVLEEARLAVGARFGAVARIVDDASDIEVLRVDGYATTTEVTTELRRWDRVPLVGSGTWEDAVRSKEGIYFSSSAERLTRYPRLGGTQRTLGFDGSATLPLLVDEHVVGVLWLGFAQPHEFSREERDFLSALARQCAQAVERARLDEAERAARAAAEAAVRARDEFLSVAAHELKTPVTSLQGFAQLELRHLEVEGKVDSARIHRAFQIMNQQSRKLSQLIQQLLDLSRIEAGKLDLNRSVAELRGLIEGVVTSTPANGAKHPIVVDAPEPVLAFIDPLRIEQVVVNLIENAIKFSPDGGVIEITMQQLTGATVMLRVRDHGLGIPPERRNHIFDRFYQAHADNYRSGMGLGLYITRQIVEQHGGSIAAEFPPEGGSTFVVTLPVQLSEENASAMPW